MYVGRIVVAGRTRSGYNAVAYRVSSRSFPNRMAVDREGTMVIVPRPGFESDLQQSPYISYNALRLAGDWAIATNGSHTDPIVEKVNAGVPVRDAMALTLLAMDYEHDAYDTPRIAAAVPLRGDTGWMAIVRRDGLVVREVPLEDGVARYVATYETNDVRDDQSSDFVTRPRQRRLHSSPSPAALSLTSRSRSRASPRWRTTQASPWAPTSWSRSVSTTLPSFPAKAGIAQPIFC